MDWKSKFSNYISKLKILWLDINDASGPSSDRAYIEKNSIALLSTLNHKLDIPKKNWLGNFNPHSSIVESSLWNVNYINTDYDKVFFKNTRGIC